MSPQAMRCMELKYITTNLILMPFVCLLSSLLVFPVPTLAQEPCAQKYEPLIKQYIKYIKIHQDGARDASYMQSRMQKQISEAHIADKVQRASLESALIAARKKEAAHIAQLRTHKIQLEELYVKRNDCSDRTQDQELTPQYYCCIKCKPGVTYFRNIESCPRTVDHGYETSKCDQATANKACGEPDPYFEDRDKFKPDLRDRVSATELDMAEAEERKKIKEMMRQGIAPDFDLPEFGGQDEIDIYEEIKDSELDELLKDPLEWPGGPYESYAITYEDPLPGESGEEVDEGEEELSHTDALPPEHPDDLEDVEGKGKDTQRERDCAKLARLKSQQEQRKYLYEKTQLERDAVKEKYKPDMEQIQRLKNEIHALQGSFREVQEEINSLKERDKAVPDLLSQRSTYIKKRLGALHVELYNILDEGDEVFEIDNDLSSIRESLVKLEKDISEAQRRCSEELKDDTKTPTVPIIKGAPPGFLSR